MSAATLDINRASTVSGTGNCPGNRSDFYDLFRTPTERSRKGLMPPNWRI